MDLTRSLAIFHITVNQYAIYGYKRIIGMVYSGAAPVAAARLRVGLIGATWTLGKPNIRSFCSISCGQRDNSVILRGPSVPRRRWSANELKADQVDAAGPADRCRRSADRSYRRRTQQAADRTCRRHGRCPAASRGGTAHGGFQVKCGPAANAVAIAPEAVSYAGLRSVPQARPLPGASCPRRPVQGRGPRLPRPLRQGRPQRPR